MSNLLSRREFLGMAALFAVSGALGWVPDLLGEPKTSKPSKKNGEENQLSPMPFGPYYVESEDYLEPSATISRISGGGELQRLL
jgi:hypothetical protein